MELNKRVEHFHAHPGPNIIFSDPQTALPDCVAEAKAEGAQIVIALTHIGADLDLSLAASSAAQEVDMFVGELGRGLDSSHSHHN